MQHGSQLVDRMMYFDKNQDKLLTRDEVPQRIRKRFDTIDANNDGFLSGSEIAEMAKRQTH